MRSLSITRLSPLAAVFAFGICNAMVGTPPSSPLITVEGPAGLIAPRDTLNYVLRWGRAPNATSYMVSVTASATPAGVTSGLPVNRTVTDTTVSFSAVNLTYDSLAFTASVTAFRGTTSNATSATAAWSVTKKVGVPGAIKIDSSAIPPFVMTTAVRPVLAFINGAEVLQWTSYDTSIVSTCGGKCDSTFTSWECPVYPAGSKFGPPPPLCAQAPTLTLWQRFLNWLSPAQGRVA
jgi:hypothetical protein